jgi:two-component system CheB/CheR fusion protein
VVDSPRAVRVFCSAHFSLRVSRRRAFYQTFQVPPEETQGRLSYDLGNRQWEFPKQRGLFHEITTRNACVDGFEVHHKFPHLGPQRMILNARRIEPPGGSQITLLSIEELTRKNKVGVMTLRGLPQ